MADEKRAKMEIEVDAVANEKSAERAVNKLADGVEKASKKGRIEVPVNINTLIDNKDTESKLSKAQKDVVKSINKMSKKGFSASAKDIDKLNSKMTEFGRQMDQAGKGRQNKIFRTIRKQVEDLTKAYKTLQVETKNAKVHNTKVKGTKPTKDEIKKGYEEYLKKQEEYSKKAQGAGKRAELRKELSEVRENKSPVKSSGNIRPSSTSDHMMRLSEYSAHGSNWANELAKTLKEEIAKSAKTLVTRFDKNYEIGTDNKIHNKKSGKATDEKMMLSDTIEKAKNELSSYISQLEAGSEEVTLDMLQESAAVIKVLTKAVGKTTEEAEKTIIQAIQGRYDQKQSSSKGGGKIGGTNLEEGQIKGVGPGHENTQKLVKQLHESMKQWDSEVIADKIAKEVALGTEKVAKSVTKRTQTTNQADKLVGTTKMSDEFKNELNKLNGATTEVFSELRNAKKATEKQTNLDKIENVREAIADSKEQAIETVNRDINKDTAGAVKKDVDTGFNTNSKADELINAVEKTEKIELPDDIISILKEILAQITTTTDIMKSKEPKRYKISKKTKSSDEKPFEPVKNALVPILNSMKISTEIPKAVSKSEFDKIVPELIKDKYENQVQKSTIYASPFRQGIFKRFEGVIEDLTGASKKYEKVLKANADDQDKMAAERIKTYGLNNGRNPNDTGDIAGMRRILQLYRTNKLSIEQNPELAQKIKLTPGREVDTTELTKELNKALSGRGMRNAQNGGGFLKNALGFMTGGIGYAFMPSLEKSRAQADGLNQVFGNINKSLQSVLINIQTKETELAGMEASGQAKFDKNGFLTADSTSAAFKTLADLEEEKLVLDSIKADLLANDEIIKKTGGRFSALVKYLNFTSPVLKENNGILRNINSGLDKNGKALKFQTRMAEILNYTYQLMSRSIGQMIKNWLSMINPINVIKKAFNDFMSYNVKWQRTMNVIKYNIRAIIRPFMDKLAQFIVNIIGFIDIIQMKIQKALGMTGISLFDQSAADAEKMKEELEAASNVTMGFDELHDIGSDNSGANDLLGDIYKPQLPKEWEDLANRIGDLFAGIIKGDLGFGEVMKEILGILGQALGLIAKMIWDWFKETAIGKYLTENWQKILGTILAIFLGWKLLKVAGSLIWNALFGNLSQSAIGGVLGKVGSWITTWFSGMFSKGGIVGAFKAGGASLGMVFATALVGVIGTALMIDAIGDAKDDASYNIGLKDAGGKDKDKKSQVGNVLKGTAGGAMAGAAIGSFIPVIGTGLGAVIGGIVGALSTALAPAFEECEVAARKMNNEMQKIEYYEGQVQGAKTQVDDLKEKLDLSNSSIEHQTDKVYDLGEKYGVSKTHLDNLVQSIKDGNYKTDMAVGLNQDLMDALDQLNWHYQNNKGVTDELTEAKRKLLKAETDLSVAQDVEAENFELAAARIENAMTQGVYTGEEAAEKLAQIMKETSFTEATELLKNASPELKKKFDEYVSITSKGMNDYAEYIKKANKEERNQLLENMDPELRAKFIAYLGTTAKWQDEYIKYYKEANDEVKKAFDDPSVTQAAEKAGEKNAEALFNGLKKANTGDKIIAWFKDLIPGGETGNDYYKRKGIASYDVGTMYVPSDGLAMIHKGEAIIPKDENVFARQGKAWDGQMAMNSQMMNAITRLEQTISQGINVKGEFRQRGNDLVATVEKVKNRNGNQPLNNSVFAR